MTPSQNEFPSPDKITLGRSQAPSKHSATTHVDTRYATEEKLPTVPTSAIRHTTPTNPVTEAEPAQTIQLMILQTIQQIQQQSQQAMQQMQQKQEELQQESRQRSQQQTRMMQQMMEQMTKLTVKQSMPQVPAPAQTQHQHRYDVGMSEPSSPPTQPARSGQMQTTTAAERRQHISKPQYDCRSQIPVAPGDGQRPLPLQSPPAQIQTDFDSQQARLAPGMYLQRSQVPQLPHTRRQHEQPRLNPRTEAPMDCKQPLSTSIETQIPWTHQKETLFVPREQSTSILPIESKILPPYLKQALPVPSTTPHSRHVHKQPPPCDRLQKQLQPVPQKQLLPTQPPQQQSLPTRQFDQACPPHAQRPAAFPLNAKTSDDAGNEDTNGIPDRSSDRSSDDSGDECYTDALDGDESLVTTHQGISEDSEEEEEDHTSSMRSTAVYLFDESTPTSPADDTSDEFPTRPGEDSDIFQEEPLNENSVVSTKDLVVGGHAENEDFVASHEDARPEDAHIEKVVGPLASNAPDAASSKASAGSDAAADLDTDPDSDDAGSIDNDSC
ncbi:hypothetical protein E4U46_000481, partial [Claviceps purpurea]